MQFEAGSVLRVTQAPLPFMPANQPPPPPPTNSHEVGYWITDNWGARRWNAVESSKTVPQPPPSAQLIQPFQPAQSIGTGTGHGFNGHTHLPASQARRGNHSGHVSTNLTTSRSLEHGQTAEKLQPLRDGDNIRTRRRRGRVARPEPMQRGGGHFNMREGPGQFLPVRSEKTQQPISPNSRRGPNPLQLEFRPLHERNSARRLTEAPLIRDGGPASLPIPTRAPIDPCQRREAAADSRVMMALPLQSRLQQWESIVNNQQVTRDSFTSPGNDGQEGDQPADRRRYGSNWRGQNSR